MMAMDDIKGETGASESVGSPAETGPRSVGPESETRGGAEAPDESLTETGGGRTQPNAGEQERRRAMRD